MSAPGVRERCALAALVAGALAVRLVGLTSGLPFAYNPDEELHFVPPAAAAADGELDPGYYQNPSALTYLLALVLRAAHPRGDLTDLLAADPGAVHLVGRVVVAVLGTLLVVVVYAVGRRCFGPSAGWWAGALIAVGFLPVHYSRQALNDVPTMLPVTVVLGAAVLAHEWGRWREVLLAGAAVGVAAATKYTAAPVALVVALAVALRVLERREPVGRAVALLAGSGAGCVAAFLLLTPYLPWRLDAVREQLDSQSVLAATGKLGQSGEAWSSYPQTLLWGFGVVPLLLAGAGLVLALRRDRVHRVRALLLVVFPVVLYAYLATQDRYFARWLLPAYPALAVLAGYAAARATAGLRERLRDRLPRRSGVTAVALVGVVVLAQPVADAVRHAVVVSRADTRTQALAWIREEVPAGARLVVDPSVPDDWLDQVPVETYPVARPYQSYELSLAPALVDDYRERGYCWVVVNSFQRDRGLAGGVAGARAYYARLARDGEVRATFSPYDEGATAPPFSYDLRFNWYAPAYERPGPLLQVVRLRDC